MAKPDKKKDLFKKNQTLLERTTPSFDPPTKKELDAYRKNHPLNRVGKSFTVPFRAIKKTGKRLLDKLRDRGPLYK